MLATALFAPAAEARKKAIWGPIVFVNGQGGCTQATKCSAFPTYDALGVDFFQFQIRWNEIAKCRPTNPRNHADPCYDWPSISRVGRTADTIGFAVLESRKFGMKPVALVRGTPGWANGGRREFWAPNRNADYANFLIAASRRYPAIKFWFIWGETNRPELFQPGGRRAPKRYAKLVKAAYPALKSVSRANIVIGGMTYNGGVPSVPKFIKNFKLKRTKKQKKRGIPAKPPKLDFFGHNPFDRRVPRLKDKIIGKPFRGLNDVDTLNKEIKRAYRTRKKKPKIWVAEWTTQSDHASLAFKFFVSRAEQARRVRLAYKLVRSVKYVKALAWFTLLDDAPNTRLNGTFGLAEFDGDRKPSFSAYAAQP